MPRKLLALLLLFSVFWSSLSAAGCFTTTERGREPGHVVLHWQDSDHHHHDDGSLHAEDSGGTAQHQHADSAANPSGLVAAGLPCLRMPCGVTPSMTAELPPPSPTLEGPLRPPRAGA